MTIDTKRLRELAEAATPGSWQSNWPHTSKIEAGEWNDIDWELGHGVAIAFTETDVDFIAAANPQTVIALLDDNERLQAENEWMRKRFDAHHPAPGSRPDDFTVTEERVFDLNEEITKLKLDLSDQHTREVWEACQRAKAEVASWPAWKRGDE